MLAVLSRPGKGDSYTYGSLALMLATGLPAMAAEPVLPSTVVTATRNAAAVEEVALTATVIDRKMLDTRLPSDEADLVRDEPDVAMARDLRRHGSTRVNIRGIEDKRVVQMVDGVRLGDYYNGGGPTNFTMAASPTAMPDFLKRVEIVRGSVSSLYGSDAIGGVVGYVTLDPADLLTPSQQNALRLRAGYFGASQGFGQTVMGALRTGSAEMLLGYSHLSSEEFDNQGRDGSVSAVRSMPNPMKIKDQGLLAKMSLRPAVGHKLGFMIEGRDQGNQSEILRLSSSLPRMTWVRGDDHARRLRASIDWEHIPASNSFYDRLTARLYHQDAQTENFNHQRRTRTSASCSAVAPGSNDCELEGDFTLDQKSFGGSLQFESTSKAWGAQHLLSYGIDLGRVSVEEFRDARIWNRTTGTFTRSLAGETFPLRDFANGNTDTLGIFVQDEIHGLADGRFTLTPGLRYDRTQLKPELDALAQQVLNQIGRQTVAQSHGSLSPKLGGVWRLTPQISAYGQVARGFRAPDYKEVNGVFRNTTQRYGVTPNADLKPETSTGVELGLRFNTDTLRTQLNVFDNRYKDFIESIRYTGCHLPGANPNCIAGTTTTYQSVNLNRVRIRGAELRAQWQSADGWAMAGALATARGDNEASGQPLDSIEPTRLTGSLSRDFGNWGGRVQLSAAARKTRVDDTNGTWFRTPGYGVTDLSAWWKIDRHTQLSVSLNNVFDKKYWLWSDIRQADANAPLAVDFYSQPGRHVNLALQMDF